VIITTTAISEKEKDAPPPTISSIEEAGAFFNSIYCNSMAIQMGSITSHEKQNKEHKIICLLYKYNNEFYHVVFKQDWFYDFAKINRRNIPDIDKNEIGQSIDMNVLDDATNLNSSLVIIMPNTKAYITKAVDAMAYVLAYDTQTKKLNIKGRKQQNEEGGVPEGMFTRLYVGDLYHKK
jgi:hypothetical protein